MNFKELKRTETSAAPGELVQALLSHTREVISCLTPQVVVVATTKELQRLEEYRKRQMACPPCGHQFMAELGGGSGSEEGNKLCFRA